MRKLVILMAIVALCGNRLYSQNIDLEYTTELQTNFKDVNWVNLLKFSFEIPLYKTLVIEGSTISAAKTRSERIIEDLQEFSNIETDNLPVGIAVCGLKWTSRERKSAYSELFVGVRNVNEDYFITPCTSLFTSSSPGIHPTVSANYALANYPLSALCIDYKQYWKGLRFEASLYNGQAYNGWRVKDNPFIFHPKSDGLFFITAFEYTWKDSNYTLGGAFDFVPTIWANVEQKITKNIHLVAQGSVNFHKQTTCRNYEAFGIVGRVGKIETGAILSHANFSLDDGTGKFARAHECTVELTCRINLSEHLYLQPTLHIITIDTSARAVGLFRLCWHIF